eukprot:TRINITY_DN5350_c0_g1_i1.p1 TRINITY_DN5350_c0_g1~~TRINITY_DN5350_c0_g1_i1.p1  ORF type:complete len:169 (-),score=33.73 TRINITY_DN5350_c0_g1_i1:223-675(-)
MSTKQCNLPPNTMKGGTICLGIWVFAVMMALVGGSLSLRENKRRASYMEESKQKGEPERDYIDEEFENIGLNNKEGTKRYRRQADTTEEPEGSGQEPLLVEDPPGIGLGFILGVASLVVLVIYIIGITYKLIKIQLGTYVEEEPVFLKYK